jgi:uncharacterized protein YjbI with pentapeptide repeats
MANEEHLDVLRRGVKAWNAWRRKNPSAKPDLSFADLQGENFDGANFRGVNFFQADLSGEASFCKTDFRGSSFEFTDLLDSYCLKADFRGALFVHATLSELDCSQADFRDTQIHSCELLEADFSSADLRSADLNWSDLSHAIFENADLRGADLTGTQMVQTRFTGANLAGARVYGVTPWEVVLDGAIQTDLVITPKGRPRVTVDDLELAQFMYLLLDNRSLGRVIDTLTSRVVLVLGRFGDARREYLDLLLTKIRARQLVPLSVDVGGTKRAPLMETTTLLARLARFVIPDLTLAPEVLQLLEAFVPEVAVPVLPIESNARGREAQFEEAWKYPWYFKPTRYENPAQLAKVLAASWFRRAESKREELRAKRLASDP